MVAEVGIVPNGIETDVTILPSVARYPLNAFAKPPPATRHSPATGARDSATRAPPPPLLMYSRGPFDGPSTSSVHCAPFDPMMPLVKFGTVVILYDAATDMAPVTLRSRIAGEPRSIYWLDADAKLIEWPLFAAFPAVLVFHVGELVKVPVRP